MSYQRERLKFLAAWLTEDDFDGSENAACDVCGRSTGGEHVTYTAADSGGFTACLDCHAVE